VEPVLAIERKTLFIGSEFSRVPRGLQRRVSAIATASIRN